MLWLLSREHAGPSKLHYGPIWVCCVCYFTQMCAHYGTLSGTLSIDGESYTLQEIFALTEDSPLIL